jgi:hypothetical protein
MRHMVRHLVAGCLLLTVWTHSMPAIADGLPENPYSVDRQRACGAMALAFMDAYLSGSHSYADVASACPPGPLGSSMEDLQTAARAMGYHTLAFEASVDGLKRLRGPAIVHCKAEKGPGHYLVVLEWNEARHAFHLFDPPRSLGECTEARLGEWITGYGLVVSKTPIAWDDAFRASDARWLHALAGALVVVGIAVLTFGKWRRVTTNECGRVAALSLFTILSFAPVGCTDSKEDATVAAGQHTERYEQDFGEVLEGREVVAVFQFCNRSSTPFRVIRVDRNCECQKVNVGIESPIAPGDCTPIEVSVPTTGSEGRIEKTFYVVTDSTDASYGVIPLVLRGLVERPLKAVPSEIMFGSIIPGNRGVEKTVLLVTNPPDLADRYIAAASSDPLVTVELRDRQVGALRFDVRLAPGCPQGVVSGEIRFNFDCEAKPVVVVPFLGRRDDLLRATPARLIVGGAADTPEAVKLRVSSTDGEAFSIVSTVAPAGVQVTWDDAAQLHSVHEGQALLRSQSQNQDSHLFVETSLPGKSALRIPILSK